MNFSKGNYSYSNVIAISPKERMLATGGTILQAAEPLKI